MAGPYERWERLRYAVAHPGRTDERTVDHLETITVTLGLLARDVENPRLLLGQVQAHLDMLTGLIRDASGSSTYQRLCSLAAEVAGQMGWLHWNLGDYVAADGYFMTGMRVAQEARDQPAIAYMLGSLASRPFRCEDPVRRLNYLTGAQGASPATQAWLYILEAGAYALQGRLPSFQVAADRAEEQLLRSLAPPAREMPAREATRPLTAREATRPLTVVGRAEVEASIRPRVGFFHPVYLAEEMASGLLRLNMPGAAQELLTAVRPQATGRLRLWVDLGLARSAADQREVELATDTALSLLEDARVAGVEPVLEGLRMLPKRLPATMPETRRLREALSLA